MVEADQRQTLIKLLRPLDAISIENTVAKGTPDMNYGGAYTFPDGNTVYLEGWIECKWAREWPKRGGPLRLKHYTTYQKVWARCRRHRGGACWVILTVGRDWILLDGVVAALLPLGDANRDELMNASVKYWDTPPDREDLIKCLLL